MLEVQGVEVMDLVWLWVMGHAVLLASVDLGKLVDDMILVSSGHGAAAGCGQHGDVWTSATLAE